MIPKKSNETILKTLNDVEIFSAGKWNGDGYSTEDIDEMIFAFESTKENFEPFIKVGHDNDQSILNSENIPSAGYVKNLKRVGNKLLADFADIPEKIYFLMKNKAYRKRSAEVFWDIEFNGKKFKRMLKAVALLGADMPGVTTLDDIINFYGLDAKKSREKDNSNVILKICNFDKKQPESKMSEKLEKEIKDLNDALDKKAKEFSNIEKTNKEKQDKFEALEKKYNAELEAKKTKAAEDKVKEVKQFASDMVTKNLATKAMKPLIETMFSNEAKEYKITQVVKKDDEELTKEKVYISKQDVFEDILKLYKEASKVNFDESSDDVDEKKGNKSDIANQKIEKYASDNKVTYSEAYKVIMSEDKED